MFQRNPLVTPKNILRAAKQVDGQFYGLVKFSQAKTIQCCGTWIGAWDTVNIIGHHPYGALGSGPKISRRCLQTQKQAHLDRFQRDLVDVVERALMGSARSRKTGGRVTARTRICLRFCARAGQHLRRLRRSFDRH